MPPFKHGHTVKPGALRQSRTYRCWAQMLQRCCNPKNANYISYGGRGILVCERWKDFRNFLADMGEQPAGLSLDRKNNNLGYASENCRWSSRLEQQNNMRMNVRITWRGETRTIAEWARHLNLSDMVLRTRLNRGWTIDRAFTYPVQVK